jgi:4'-phosphopantetheinyl transferase
VIATLYASSAAPWPLRAGVVHVWRFANDQPADPRWLSADETAQAARFAARAHRDAYVVQHAMVRVLLARYLEVEPSAVVFERGPRGKPHVAGLRHNLAHADDTALLAVALDVELGVDLERYDAAIEPAQLARLVLAPAEAHCVERRAFLRVWCRKEACLKATGVGLLDDLTSITVLDDVVTLDGATLHVQDLALDIDHAAALATLQPCGAIRGPLEDYFVKS